MTGASPFSFSLLASLWLGFKCILRWVCWSWCIPCKAISLPSFLLYNQRPDGAQKQYSWRVGLGDSAGAAASASPSSAAKDKAESYSFSALEQQLSRQGAASVPHLNNKSLLDHCVLVRKILAQLGMPPHVCRAGLFHSVYGSELFPEAIVPMTHRCRVAGLIGEEAERLVYLYGTASQVHIYRTLLSVNMKHTASESESAAGGGTAAAGGGTAATAQPGAAVVRGSVVAGADDGPGDSIGDGVSRGMTVLNYYTHESARLPPDTAAHLVMLHVADVLAVAKPSEWRGLAPLHTRHITPGLLRCL